MGDKLQQSRLRLTITGNILRLREYEKPVRSGYSARRSEDAEEITEAAADAPKDVQKALEQRGKSNIRARREVIDLVNVNFPPTTSKFATFTHAENVTDLDESHAKYKRFVQRLRRRYADFKYLTVTEFQKRGAAHYHMLSTLPYIPEKELRELWGQGFIKINAVDHVDNVGAYIAKYMTKAEADPRMIGRKSYMTSKNLEKPRVITDEWEIARILREHGIVDRHEDKRKVFTASFDSEHYGKIIDSDFNLNPNHEFRLSNKFR